eukprot:CAMPEP_0179175916 /NCGR_PEP_ID=MMETSP0796-20121207/86927_1 /TAXON_ID=73915 /ORGANISM="Pyrodinium bahamense, Strain pbaha01" /LENGTH=58 /DNA_ID=CAMNT_0020879343 /DNA_START=11 /DNA_END=183 /DNA_ORIENTATION=-
MACVDSGRCPVSDKRLHGLRRLQSLQKPTRLLQTSPAANCARETQQQRGPGTAPHNHG